MGKRSVGRATVAGKGSRPVVVSALERRQLLSTTFTVNTFADQMDPAESGTVSLRDAFVLAASTPGGATVAVPGGEYGLTEGYIEIDETEGAVAVRPVAGTGTPVFDGLGGQVLVIGGGSTVSVTGCRITGADSLGDVAGAVNNAGSLTLASVTVDGSRFAYSQYGAGIYNLGEMLITGSTITNNGGPQQDGIQNSEGGGIFNRGDMTLVNSTVSGNTAAFGGGIFNTGTLTVTSSAVSGNRGYIAGGGIDNAGGLTLSNSTVAQNVAEYEGGGFQAGGTVTLTNCTVTGNRVDDESGLDGESAAGGGIYEVDASVKLSNTIVAGNTVTDDTPGSPTPVGPDVSGSIYSYGHNLIGVLDGSSGFTSTDLFGTSTAPRSAGLSSLGNHGGPVATQVPLGGSAAVNAGSNALSSGSTDARGYARKVGGTVDIGAVETQVVVTAAAAQSAKAGAAATVSLGSFADPGGTGPYAATVSWGDGSANTTFAVSGPGSLGTKAHTYAAAGTFRGTVTVTDGYRDSAAASSDPTVTVSGPTSTPTRLTGTVVGTGGSYNNGGHTIDKAEDGSLSTFFDGPTANGDTVGLDLGSAHAITSLAYASRPGFASRMNGGRFQASNSATFATGNVTLYTIAANANPGSTALTTRSVAVSGTYRYVRYVSPAGSYGDVSEVQFFGTGAAAHPKLSGTVIGTGGSYQNDGNTIAKATDGSLSTFFDGPSANDNWVGLDLGSAKAIAQVSFAPRSGLASRMVGGQIQVSTTANFSSGVTTLYTIKTAPTAGVLTTVAVSATARYIRYLSPAGSYGDIAEFQVFG